MLLSVRLDLDYKSVYYFLFFLSICESHLSPLLILFRALASKDATKKKKKKKLHPQTLLYLFYQLILQLILHPSFYFYIQSNKIK